MIRGTIGVDMRSLKRLIAIIGGGIVGIVLLVFGVKEYFQTKSLQAKGKATTAEVTNAEERSGRRGRKRYYLTAHFKTESGQTITSEERVSRSTFDEGASSRKIRVTYLPDSPEVCRMGANVSTNWANLGFGVFMLGFSAVSAFTKSH
jgi:hypothetical protein